MPVSREAPNTSVLLIDCSMNQRTHWADELKRVSPDYWPNIMGRMRA
jgi:hypothetical protein